MEDDLKKKMKTTKKNGKGIKQKRKTNQSTKISLIGCDTIVNSPSIKLRSDLKCLFLTYILLCNV